MQVSYEEYMIPCLNKQLFGFDCPGCGLQRSAMLVTQGEFKEAFYMYPAIYPILLLLLCILIFKYKQFRYSNYVLTGLSIITGAVILISYIIKMTR